MIETYFAVNRDGFITDKFQFDDKRDAPLPQLIKKWEGRLLQPRYDFLNQRWVEADPTLALDTFKKEKKIRLEKACQTCIEAGFQHEIKGVRYHFRYDAQTQTNFQDTDWLFQNGMVEEVSWTAYQNGEKRRLVLQEEGFTKLYLSAVKHKQDALLHLYNVLFPMVEAAVGTEALDQIEWGNPEGEFILHPGASIGKKVESLATEVSAQKMQSEQMEMVVLSVADIALMASFDF